MRRLRAVAALLVALCAVAALAAPAGAAAKPPKRIAALTPFTANTLAKLGVKPVAIGETLGGRERFDRRLRGVRSLPLSHPNGPNLEQLAALRPDLVFNSPTFAKGSAGMRELGIRVDAVDPTSIAESVAAIQRIGAIVGRRKQAKKLAIDLLIKVGRARSDIRDRPTVLLILGVGRTSFVFLPGSWGADVIQRAGGTLLTGGLKNRGFARISDETVVAEDPDVIIAVPHAAAKDIPSITRYLRGNPAWATTRAVRDKRVYVSTDNSLLQASTDPDRVIRFVRSRYLKNLK